MHDAMAERGEIAAAELLQQRRYAGKRGVLVGDGFSTLLFLTLFTTGAKVQHGFAGAKLLELTLEHAAVRLCEIEHTEFET
jgi:hypothetical protein